MSAVSPLDLAWDGTLLLVSAASAMWIFIICARWWRARSSARREAQRIAAETAIFCWAEKRDEACLGAVLALKPRSLLDAVSTAIPRLDAPEREALISALAHTRFAKYVRRHFNTADESQRLLCCEILGAMGGRARSQTLLDALIDPAPSVRIGAAISLAQSGDLPSLDETFEKLGPDGLASSRLIHFFEPLLPARRNEVVALAKDISADSQVRVSALTALSRQEDPDLVALLKELANDEASPVVIEVARLLGELADPEGSPVLASLLKKECVYIRRAAAQSVGSLGNDNFSYTLLPVLMDDDNVVRQSAERSMGQLAMLSHQDSTQHADAEGIRSEGTGRLAA